MKQVFVLSLLVLAFVSLSSAQKKPRSAEPTKAPVKTQPGLLPDIVELDKMAARFAPTPLRVNTNELSPGDHKALVKLIEAGRIINDLFMAQYWSGDRALYKKLQSDNSPLGKARLRYFWINKGPWSGLDDHRAFLPGVPPKKLPGANFYPEDMTKEEFEKWTKTLSPDQKKQAEGFFTVIRRDASKNLIIVPYSEEYKADLERTAALLREAATLTENETLKNFLNKRADAFLSNKYYDSDVAWMDLDAPLDVTIGPYEVYNDEIFGYKAAFEAYINLRDDAESAKLSAFSKHLQEIENNLPLDPQYRNPKLGESSPIRVVNEILSAGDGDHGVQTAAYNLPNDEQVVAEKGSKRVMLKNVQEAKFRGVLLPIASRTLSKQDQADISFEMFFTHILAHELMHGLGPHQITIKGRQTTVRQELKDIYSAIEEAKADATGLFALQYMMDHASEMNFGPLLKTDKAAQRQLYVTFLASAFRSLRFGLNEAHGKGMALQVNYLIDKGAFVPHADGTFSVNFEKVKPAVRDLTHDLLTLEATGNYAGAKKMLTQLAVLRPEVATALNKLNGIPTDIEPVFVTADQLTGKGPAEAPKPAKQPRKAKIKMPKVS